MRTILAAVALATALHAAGASAQESIQQTEDRERRFRELEGYRHGSTSSAKMSSSSGVHRYQGMYFRPEFGFGYMSVSAGSGKYSGPSGAFGLHFGGALTPDVLLGVHFYEAVMANPTASGDFAGADTSNSAIAAAAIGPELTVCLSPNFYGSATVAVTRLGVAEDTGAGTAAGSSKGGVGARLALGYDHWATSGNWALGAAVNASYSRNQFEGVDTTLNTLSVGASFSLTWD